MSGCSNGMVRIEMKQGERPITEYLSNAFMRKYTNFNSFKELTFSSLVWIDWKKDIVITPEHLLNRFIATSTVFNSWDEMLASAMEQHGGASTSHSETQRPGCQT